LLALNALNTLNALRALHAFGAAKVGNICVHCAVPQIKLGIVCVVDIAGVDDSKLTSADTSRFCVSR
jgi:hypothetical protein